MAVMRFVLVEREKRLFLAERFCFRGSVDDPVPLKHCPSSYENLSSTWARNRFLSCSEPIMKASEVREHLAQLDADQLRSVAEHLYKMLPRKMASEKGADLLIADAAAFQQSRRAKKAPELPDLDLVEMETDEFLEDAAASRYFAPNNIISKAARGRWRSVAKRLYQDWCLLAGQSEYRSTAATALERLYRILCRGSQVYLFRTATRNSPPVGWSVDSAGAALNGARYIWRQECRRLGQGGWAQMFGGRKSWIASSGVATRGRPGEFGPGWFGSLRVEVEESEDIPGAAGRCS